MDISSAIDPKLSQAALVANVQGVVQIIDSEGNIRNAVVGEMLQPGERIIADNGQVVLQAEDGSFLNFGQQPESTETPGLHESPIETVAQTQSIPEAKSPEDHMVTTLISDGL